MSASGELRSVIFVPKTAPPAKVAQLLVYGSIVFAVDGTYDHAFDLCVQACHAFGWYNRNTGYNPYMTEGKKTVSFEIAEQLTDLDGMATQGASPQWLRVPDAVFVSVGDGSIIGGVYKGFKDLLALGWAQRMPRIYGVQSSRSDALARAWQQGQEIPVPVQATTLADSISVNAPRDPVKALAAVRESGGAFVVVSDEAILSAILPLARLAGVFAEPAGAAAYAGMREAARMGLLQHGDDVVVINTGSGLKDIAAALRVVGQPLLIPPNLEAVHRYMNTISSS
jgi:threonine synthase